MKTVPKLVLLQGIYSMESNNAEKKYIIGFIETELCE